MAPELALDVGEPDKSQSRRFQALHLQSLLDELGVHLTSRGQLDLIDVLPGLSRPEALEVSLRLLAHAVVSC